MGERGEGGGGGGCTVHPTVTPLADRKKKEEKKERKKERKNLLFLSAPTLIRKRGLPFRDGSVDSYRLLMKSSWFGRTLWRKLLRTTGVVMYTTVVGRVDDGGSCGCLWWWGGGGSIGGYRFEKIQFR